MQQIESINHFIHTLSRFRPLLKDEGHADSTEERWIRQLKRKSFSFIMDESSSIVLTNKGSGEKGENLYPDIRYPELTFPHLTIAGAIKPASVDWISQFIKGHYNDVKQSYLKSNREIRTVTIALVLDANIMVVEDKRAKLLNGEITGYSSLVQIKLFYDRPSLRKYFDRCYFFSRSNLLR